MMFAIFLNLSIFFIASTGFFPHTFYGDATTYDVDDPEYDIKDPDKLPSADKMFTRLITNSVDGTVANIFGYTLTFPILMASILAISIVIGMATKTSNGVSLLIVGLMFTVMWANSKRIIDSLVSGLDSSVNYLILIFLVGVMISFVILIFDTASGQKSTK